MPAEEYPEVDGLATDQTKTEGAETVPAQPERTYRSIFEHATEGIFQASLDGRFLSANPALARLLGYSSPTELMGIVRDMRSQLFVDPLRHGEMVRLLNEHSVLPSFEAQMRRSDGIIRWVSLDVRTVRDDHGSVLFHEGTMRDITKRKLAEEALAESEERYRTVIEYSNDGIAMVHDGRHLFVNRRFVEMFGYTDMDEIIGEPIIRLVHPDDRERVTEINARRKKGERVPERYEFKGITRDGGTLEVEVSARGVTYRNLPVMLVFLRDVTERKRAEEIFLQSHRQLEQLNRAKTKAVNHISHELKTPLSVIQGNMRLLRRRLEGTPFAGQVGGMIETVERHLERLFRMQKEADEILRTSREMEAAGLVDELERLRERVGDLSEVPPEVFSCWENVTKWVRSRMPGGSEAFQTLDLQPFLAQSITRARRRATKRDVALRVEGAGDICVLMDPGILREVMDGLIRNGIEHTPDGGSVTVSVEEKDEEVLLHVIDTGVGITGEDQQYIFDGLFHAKDTELYASKRPYDFDAGGKGLDLLRMKVYAERFGFGLSVKSSRCPYLLGDAYVCPGDVSKCVHCKTAGDCQCSGGTTFTVSFMKDRCSVRLPESSAGSAR